MATTQHAAERLASEMLAGLAPPRQEVSRRIGILANTLDQIELVYETFDLRRHFVRQFSFALPCREAIRCIRDAGRPIVEVGAGTGFWSQVLASHGVDIIATDVEAGRTSQYNQAVGNFCRVSRVAAHVAVSTWHDRDVLICWPSYEEEWASEAVAAVSCRPGRRVYYIGEMDGGCCGTDEMFSVLNGRFRRVATVPIPQWPGMHDTLSVYEAL